MHLMSNMMNTADKSVVEAQDIVSSDSADVEHTTEVKASDHATNEKGITSELSVPENKTHLCDPCVIDELENTACAFCIVCVEYLCESCCREHKKHKATRRHEVLKDHLPADPSVFKYFRKMTNCSVHGEMEVTHKCEDHNIYVCLLCTVGTHRKCETVIELSASYDLPGNGALEVKMKIKELKEKSHTVSITQSSHIIELTKEKKDIIATVSNDVSSFTSDLLEMKNKLVKDAEMMTEEHLKSLKENATKCTHLEDECNLFREVIEAAEQYGTNTEMKMVLTDIQEKLVLTEREIEKQQNREEMHLFYTRNKQMSLFQNLGTLELTCKQKTKDGEYKNDEIIESDVSRKNKFKEITTQTEEQIEVTDDIPELNEQFCIKIGDDFCDCSISGCAILDDGTIVIIDEENRKIKTFASSFMGICALVCIAPPSDICVIDRYEFAVVFKMLKKIQFVNLEENNLSIFREIPTKYENRQITANRTSKQLALVYKTDFRLRGFIQIRHFSGQVIQDIDIDSILGVSDRRDIGICYMQDELVVVNRSIGVQCLIPRRSGHFILGWQFNLDENIDVTRYISADKDGNIYICSQAENSIYQVSRDHTEPNILKIQNPLSVANDQARKRLIVGCFMTNYAHIIPLC